VKRRRLLTGIGAGGVLSALAAACGDMRNKSQDVDSTVTGQPRTGGQINLSMPSDPYDLDPTTGEMNGRRILPMIYDSLLSVESGPGVDYNDLVIRPGLADRWESPDGQTYTFHLHADAAFANIAPVYGRAITSADVKWSLEYVARLGDFKSNGALRPALYGSIFAGMQNIETPDSRTVVIRFNAPYVPFSAYAAADWTAVLPHEVYDEDGNFSSRAVGSGPWQIDPNSSQQGSRWLLRRNQSYFVPSRPYIDVLNMLVIKDDATQAAAFAAKQLDMLPGTGSSRILDRATVEQATRDNPTAVRYSFLSPSSGILYWNTRRPPLNDERVRRAIALCINRDEIIKTISGNGEGKWALAGTLPGVFDDAEVHRLLPYDPGQAARLVTDAGFANGVSLSFMLDTDGGQQLTRLVELVQAQLKRGNIDVQIEPVTLETDGARRRAGDYQLSYTPGLVTLDIDSYLVGQFYSKSPTNALGISDPDLDNLILAQRAEFDSNKRLDLIRRAVRLINEHSYALAFYYPTGYVFWQPRLKNYSPNWGALAPELVNSWLAA
jgi:peptide/nickel transport system substrate-binding protein